LTSIILSDFKEVHKVGDVVRSITDDSFQAYGVDFVFSCDGRKVDVAILPQPGKERLFEEYVEIEDKLSLKVFPLEFRERMKKAQNYLKSRNFHKEGQDENHFSCEFSGTNEIKSAYSILDYLIRPILLFYRENK
jgi:hypothetical protein